MLLVALCLQGTVACGTALPQPGCFSPWGEDTTPVLRSPALSFFCVAKSSFCLAASWLNHKPLVRPFLPPQKQTARWGGGQSNRMTSVVTFSINSSRKVSCVSPQKALRQVPGEGQAQLCPLLATCLPAVPWRDVPGSSSLCPCWDLSRHSPKSALWEIVLFGPAHSP